MSDFGFLSPGRLAILILPVALAVGYLVLQARRRRYAVRFTTVEMLDQVAPGPPRVAAPLAGGRSDHRGSGGDDGIRPPGRCRGDP